MQSKSDEQATPHLLKDHGDITRGVREALLADAPAFFDGLYDPEGIPDPDVRPLVAMTRDEASALFARVRERLSPASCEALGEEAPGTSYVGRFLINGETRIEVVVDDLHARDGGLRTRDQVQVRLLSAK